MAAEALVKSGGVNASARFVVTDLSPKMVSMARDRLEKSTPANRVQLEVASMNDLSAFTDGSFDRILANLVLQLTPDMDGTLQEFSRYVLCSLTTNASN